MRKVLGLDLGTNSIGWALVGTDENGNPRKIINAGSRIIPMDAGAIGDFNKGTIKTQTSERTRMRGVRRLRERELLRRERLHRVLNILGFLPNHYASSIGWDKNENKTYGKFLQNTEPKLAWKIQENGKYEFLFKSSFEEMLREFSINQPQLIENNKKVPYDWTIYYLRKKALSEKITKEELAWIILNFNQKRGYYQLRGEDENTDNIREYVECLKVVQIEKGNTDKKNINRTWYNIKLENNWVYSATFTTDPNWLNQTKEFLITEELDQDGNIKIIKDKKSDAEGKEKRKISILPSFEEIELMSQKDKDKIFNKIKVKTELTIIESKKTVGTYIYETLLKNPSQKVRGKLVRTIERKFYREELCAILEKQIEFHSELKDVELYKSCLNELYAKNEAHKNNIAKRDFVYLFLNDIIFYQRPLKSKKSLISDCAFEERYFKVKDKEGNEKEIKQPLKCIAKSNPLFQEFRLWKFIANLKIYQREKEVNGKLLLDVDVTNEFIKNEDDFVALFEWLNDRKDIEQDPLLGTYFKIKKTKGKDSIYPYRWNYVEDKSYPCNETRSLILNNFKKSNVPIELTRELEMSLWHILYSVEDKQEIEKAFKTFAKKNNLPIEFVETFKSSKPFKKEYGSFSEKAIKKLLPLMRMGKYWDENAIDVNTRERIGKIISGEFDEKIEKRVREKAINLSDISHFKGLPEWLSSYIVYNRFSETKDIVKWESPEQLNEFINKFKQHSLRNPIVEQVILETLRTVRDIWEKEGKIDEIHVELGREMKNDKKERERLTKMVSEHENTNSRIRNMLIEFQNPELEIDDVRPYSPSQQEILKIYEEYAIGNLDKEDKEYEFINKISKSSQPTKNDILRYKLWLEQKYHSPYTGKMIPLSKLFTTAYQIEHIIPQSRYFDDSFSNKVICEAEVNKLKDNQLGYEFIKNHHGEKVQINENNVTIFSVEEYEKFVQKFYSNIRGKMKKLLMDEIPEKFIERQLNDTRYISKEIKRLLSNIVREKLNNGELEQEETSKNLISCTGAITSKLKQDWGLNDKWNELVMPRFKRLNEIEETKEKSNYKKCFTSYNKEGHEIPDVPLELKKGFTVKRIDHRHHAMDAIIIACATRNHVNYLNNESAKDENKRYDLKHLLCDKTKTDEIGNYKWVFKKPWDNFPNDTKAILEEIMISFKQNLRVINNNTNYYQKYDDKGKKVFEKQVKGDNWAIRKPLHKETVFGEVNLRKIKEVRLSTALENPKSIVDKELKVKINELLLLDYDIKKIKKYFEENKDIWSDINPVRIKVYYFTKDNIDPKTGQPKERYFSTRKILDTSFDRKKITESVTDTGTQKILLNHLCNYERFSFVKDKKIVFEILKDKNSSNYLNDKIKIEEIEFDNLLTCLDCKFFYKGIEIKLDEEIQIKEDEKIIFNDYLSYLKNDSQLYIITSEYSELAFSPEGIEEMNSNIKELNNGKYHKPIIKVRWYEKADKFTVGEKGNKKDKFVEAAKGTNLVFAVYRKETYYKKEDKIDYTRNFETIPLNIVIERQKHGLSSAPEINKNGDKLLFVLSPNDLVYVPTEEEKNKEILNDRFDKKRLYKFVSCTGNEGHFIPFYVANPIIDTVELGSNNKAQRSWTNEMIKECCVPLKVNRLGNITM